MPPGPHQPPTHSHPPHSSPYGPPIPDRHGYPPHGYLCMDALNLIEYSDKKNNIIPTNKTRNGEQIISCFRRPYYRFANINAYYLYCNSSSWHSTHPMTQSQSQSQYIRLVAQVISSLTASLRFDGALNVNVT
eukprot:405133_1